MKEKNRERERGSVCKREREKFLSCFFKNMRLQWYACVTRKKGETLRPQ